MAKKPELDEEEPEINMTPMLDIVFIMLIFFIVTAVFVKEAGIDVDRPDAQTADQVDRVSIIIAVSNNDEVWINKNEVDVRDITPIVQKLKKENPKGKIVIQADEKSKSGLVVDIMDQLNALGVAGVAISTLEDS